MIKDELRHTYFYLVIPLLIILLLVYLGKITGILSKGELESNRIISIFVLILVSIFSLGLPILYRAVFVTRIKDKKSISREEFLKFEKNILMMVLIAPYFVVAALVLNLPKFYFAAVIIIAIYAVYYYFPSNKRIEFEKKIFRIKE